MKNDVAANCLCARITFRHFLFAYGVSWRLGQATVFHYAILVADRSEAGRRPASSCQFAASELDDRPNSSSLQVCDRLRTCLRPGQRNGIWLLSFPETRTMRNRNFLLLQHRRSATCHITGEFFISQPDNNIASIHKATRQSTFLLKTRSNVDRFIIFFQAKLSCSAVVCSILIVKNPTTPQVCRHTAL